MSFLIFVKRHQAIIARKNDVNFELQKLNDKLMDLQKYATAVADGTVSINDLSDVPSDYFKRMSVFMIMGHQAGMANVQQNMQMMQATRMLDQVKAQAMQAAQGQGAQAQQQADAMYQQYINSMKLSFYNKAKEDMAKAESNILNAEEKKMDQKKAQLEGELKLLDAQEQDVIKGEEDGAKNSSPHYVA